MSTDKASLSQEKQTLLAIAPFDQMVKTTLMEFARQFGVSEPVQTRVSFGYYFWFIEEKEPGGEEITSYVEIMAFVLDQTPDSVCGISRPQPSLKFSEEIWMKNVPLRAYFDLGLQLYEATKLPVDFELVVSIPLTTAKEMLQGREENIRLCSKDGHVWEILFGFPPPTWLHKIFRKNYRPY